ncbi:MAG: cupin domain-containing protein [Cypionkella sp.]|nr:cupin domain-containing protein [Cypionkella sp.]
MRIDLSKTPVKTGSIYPAPYAEMMAGRSSQRLGDAGGLTQFGVNLVTLQAGALSSLRHWHLAEDEFVMVTAGEVTMIIDAGPEVMRAGDCAAFQQAPPMATISSTTQTRPRSFWLWAAKPRAKWPPIPTWI